MPSYVVEYDPEMCIICKKCAEIDPELWDVPAGGKAVLKGGQQHGSIFKVEIAQDKLELAKKTASNCPMKIIHILDQSTLRHII